MSRKLANIEFANGIFDASVWLWEPRTAEEVGRIYSTNFIDDLAWSPDGRLFAAKSGAIFNNFRIMVWDVLSRQIVTVIPLDEEYDSFVRSPDSTHVLGWVSDTDMLRMWDVSIGLKVSPPNLQHECPYLREADWHSRTGYLAVYCDRGIVLYRTDTEETRFISTGGYVSGFAWSPSGQLLAIKGIGEDPQDDFFVYDVVAGELTAFQLDIPEPEFDGLPPPTQDRPNRNSITWSSDEATLFWNFFGFGSLWDTQSEEAPIRFRAGDAASWNPTMNVIAAINDHRDIDIWNMDDLSLLHSLEIPFVATNLDWSPDGGFLAVGTEDGTIAIFRY